MVDEDGESSSNTLVGFAKVRVVTGKSVVRSRVAFSNDSRSLFCGYGSNIRVHSVKTGELVSVFKGHTGEVSDLTLNTKNSLQLLSCCLDGHIIFWDILDGSIISRCRSENSIYGITVHKDHPHKLFLVQENKNKKGHFYLGNAHIEQRNKTLKENAPFLNIKEICHIDHSGSYSFSSQGEVVASVSDDLLQLWYFKNKRLRRYPMKGVVSVAFHPTDLCLATGHCIGKIIIWRNIGLDLEPICTKLHWHAHPVASIAFSFDGAYLYSGGEESVLVLWQFETGHKQFKPRLGAPISHIVNSLSDTVIAVCHTDNVINLVSAVDLSVVNVVQGLTKATHFCSGLVADPLSKSLVLNSQDGVLQFYRPDTDSLAFTLNIVCQNYISKPGKGEPLQMTVVEQASFSTDGEWLATVERRDDGKTTPEIRLKFWKFDKETQRYVLNTCIDPPHEGKVVAVEFQPDSYDQPLAMTASVDGKFKIWVLKKQQVIQDIKYAWQCQSVGYLRDEPVQDANFSFDGSLLAVAYDKAATLWDPLTNELNASLYSPFSQPIKHIKFGRHCCSHILLASTQHDYLVAWNLLSCTVLWTVKASPIIILPDPSTHLVVVFLLFSGRRVHVYIFDPRSPIPVTIIQNALKNYYPASAVFQPNMKGLTIHQNDRDVTMARLFFMSKEQILLTIESLETDESFPEETFSKPEESEFYRVFGEINNPATKTEVPLSTTAPRTSSSKIREMFNSPSHVLPPVSSLCSTFLRSLLIPKNPKSDTFIDEVEEHDDEKDLSLGTSTSDDDLEITDTQMETLNNNFERKEKAEELPGEQTLRGLNESNFEWMKDLFKSLE